MGEIARLKAMAREGGSMEMERCRRRAIAYSMQWRNFMTADLRFRISDFGFRKWTGHLTCILMEHGRDKMLCLILSNERAAEELRLCRIRNFRLALRHSTVTLP